MNSDGQWCMSDNDVCMIQVAEWIMKVEWEMQRREDAPEVDRLNEQSEINLLDTYT